MSSYHLIIIVHILFITIFFIIFDWVLDLEYFAICWVMLMIEVEFEVVVLFWRVRQLDVGIQGVFGEVSVLGWFFIVFFQFMASIVYFGHPLVMVFVRFL
jgi:hypothetical protein